MSENSKQALREDGEIEGLRWQCIHSVYTAKEYNVTRTQVLYVPREILIKINIIDYSVYSSGLFIISTRR